MLNPGIRHRGKDMKWSAYSLLSLLPALLLHLVHGLVAPLLVGAAADMHVHHHEATGHWTGGVAGLLTVGIVAANAVSAYFAARQLVQAWKDRGAASPHTYFCSAVSVCVMAVAVYSTFLL